MKINKRRALRAASQGRDKKAELERNHQFDIFAEKMFAEMKAHNATMWPPLTAQQIEEFKIEDQVDKLIPNVPHAHVQHYGYHVSLCFFCQRTRKAHIHYSTRTFNDLINELKSKQDPRR